MKQAIHMIEESLLEFLQEKNSEKRLLFELTATSTGHLIQPHNSTRFVLREYEGVKRWWSLLDLPCGRDKEYHGSFLSQSTLPDGNDCKIELFGEAFGAPLTQASPYVLISGTKQKQVKIATSIVWGAMRLHQNNCNCKPKW
jgi:hypothetical protein